MNSQLQPTQIVDKNGIITHRNKKPIGAPTSNRASGVSVPKTIIGTSSENLQNLDDFVASYIGEFKRRGYVENEDNKRAQTVKEIAHKIEGAYENVSRKYSNPDDVVTEMYDVFNAVFDDNKYSPDDSDDETYTKTVNREFILDATLLLGGRPAVMYPEAADL